MSLAGLKNAQHLHTLKLGLTFSRIDDVGVEDLVTLKDNPVVFLIAAPVRRRRMKWQGSDKGTTISVHANTIRIGYRQRHK
jgi:hypothetical protein